MIDAQIPSVYTDPDYATQASLEQMAQQYQQSQEFSLEAMHDTFTSWNDVRYDPQYGSTESYLSLEDMANSWYLAQILTNQP